MTLARYLIEYTWFGCTLAFRSGHITGSHLVRFIALAPSKPAFSKLQIRSNRYIQFNCILSI